MTASIMLAARPAAHTHLVKNAARSLDYQVILAPSIPLALFLARKNLPDLIICGTELIDGTVHDLLAELRADTELRVIPCIVLTHAGLSKAEIDPFMQSGAALVLDQTLTPERLASAIRPLANTEKSPLDMRVIDTTE